MYQSRVLSSPRGWWEFVYCCWSISSSVAYVSGRFRPTQRLVQCNTLLRHETASILATVTKNFYACGHIQRRTICPPYIDQPFRPIPSVVVSLSAHIRAPRRWLSYSTLRWTGRAIGDCSGLLDGDCCTLGSPTIAVYEGASRPADESQHVARQYSS